MTEEFHEPGLAWHAPVKKGQKPQPPKKRPEPEEKDDAWEPVYPDGSPVTECWNAAEEFGQKAEILQKE